MSYYSAHHSGPGVAAAASSAVDASSAHLTDEERAVYDRQLRVWGVEAQKR